MRPAPPLLALIAWIAWPSDAWAVTIKGASCTKQSSNELRFDCDVETNIAAKVHINFCDSTAGGAGCTKDRSSIKVDGTQHFSGCTPPLLSCWKYEVPVWALVETHTHEWEAVAKRGSTTDTFAGSPDFVAGSLPSELSDISVSTTGTAVETEYMLLNYGCDTTAPTNDEELDYAIVLDEDGEVVWYEDVRDVTGDSEANIAAIRMHQKSKNIMVAVDHDWYIEYDRSGAVIGSLERDAGDFEDAAGTDRHVHHDVFKSKGETFVLTAHEETWTDVNDCDADTETSETFTYIVDGVMVFDSNLNYDRDWSATDAFPAEDCHFFKGTGGPGYWTGTYTGIDWVHANSIFVDGAGDWLVSLNFPSVVAEIDGTSGQSNWELHGDNTESGDGDWDIAVPPTVSVDDFNKQHHAWWTVDGTMMLFDNHISDDINESTSRGIEIEFDTGASEFDIVDDWDTTYDCPATGSTFDILPGGNILTTCSAEGTRNDKITEFGRSTGADEYEVDLGCSTGGHNTTLYRAQPFDVD